MRHATFDVIIYLNKKKSRDFPVDTTRNGDVIFFLFEIVGGGKGGWKKKVNYSKKLGKQEHKC